MTPDELLAACRVPDNVQPRDVGLWQIRRWNTRDLAGSLADWIRTLHGAERWTTLHRWTDATLHRQEGECVMDDGFMELRRHLPILLAGEGRILVSGLGLGCVVRGLLAKPSVRHIDVLEIDPAIVDLVGREFVGNPRVTLHLADAEQWDPPAGVRYDFAWHDVWSEREALPLVHARLLGRYADVCDRQGAWQMPRAAKRAMPSWYIGGPRRRVA